MTESQGSQMQKAGGFDVRFKSTEITNGNPQKCEY